MILLISANFPPEPVVAASLSDDLARSLSEKMKVRVLTPRPSRPLGFAFNGGKQPGPEYEHIVLGSFTYARSRIGGRLMESYSFGKHAAAHIRKNNDDIQCCYVSAWPLFAQYLIIKTLKRYSIPSVVHIQDIYPESLSNKIPLFGDLIKIVLRPMDKYILQNSTRVVAISQNMCDTFIRTRGLSKDRIDIVQNWKNEDEFLNVDDLKVHSWRSKVKDGSFILMFLGNIGAVAGVDLLIRGFARAGIDNSVLIIAGCGSAKKDCMKLAASLKLSNIEFWDVPDGEVAAVQKIAHVMLLPVKKGAAMSSVPSKLLAYMFSAKPVIACLDDHSDTAAAILDAGCGWISPPEDVDALAAIMREVASKEQSDLLKHGENGFNYALKSYSRKRNLEKLVSVII